MLLISALDFVHRVLSATAEDPVVETYRGLTDLLRSGGPYAVTVFAVAYGVYKDREKAKADREHFLATKEMSEKMIEAMVEHRRTLESMKDVLQRVGVCNYRPGPYRRE